jgi:O-antigen ligase
VFCIRQKRLAVYSFYSYACRTAGVFIQDMMANKLFSLCGRSLMFLVLAFCLFADSRLLQADASLDAFWQWAGNIFQDPRNQWMVFAWLTVNFLAVFIFRFRADLSIFWRLTNSNLWLMAMLNVATIVYARSYSTSFQSGVFPAAQPMVLLAGALFGQIVALWVARQSGQHADKHERYLIMSAYFTLLAIVSVWCPNSGPISEYAGFARLSGPWDNPNIFGLLMATGGLLALGLELERWKVDNQKPRAQAKNWKATLWKYGRTLLWVLVLAFLGRGLLKSYSRGAWLAAICGAGYLVYQVLKNRVSTSVKAVNSKSSLSLRSIFGIRQNWLPLALIVLSIAMLLYQHFGWTEWRPARRALSAVNSVDFSWRNRIAAWEGALQITAEHPWFGVGWNNAQLLYDHYYLPPKLAESAAIELNDYLMLAITLGLPALFCFGMYLWLSLGKDLGVKSQKSEPTSLDWLRTTCRASAIVLLVGFWFDGGLFKLATASTFWILLGLGSCEPPQGRGKAYL